MRQEIDIGRVPPQCVDIEESVLGTLMTYKNCINVVSDIISPEMFYKEAHQLIYKAIQALHHKNEPIDMLTVINQLRSMGKLEIVGGPYAISLMTNKVSNDVHIEKHAKIIQEKFLAREVIRGSSEMINEAYQDTTDIFELIDGYALKCEALNNVILNNKKPIDKHDLIKMSISELQDREESFRHGRPQGIPTGIHELNKITGGWQKQDLIILAARPSVGKTSVAIKFINTACLNGYKVRFFSLEMGKVKIMDKFIMANSGVCASVYRKGNLITEEWNQVNNGVKIVEGFDIVIDDKAAITPAYIKNSCRQAAINNEIDMIVIDYLQLMNPSYPKKGQNREQEVASMSGECKQIAKEFNVPVILLSQLSRDVEKRGGVKKPVLSDLRESGAIEQDADIVMFIYRPAYHGIETDLGGNSTAGIGELIIGKHRNGSLGSVFFEHNEEMTKITDFKTETEEQRF